jgi:hypothetical protein
MHRGKELKEERHLVIRKLQPELQVLDPLAKLEYEAVEDSQFVFYLLASGGVKGWEPRTPRLSASRVVALRLRLVGKPSAEDGAVHSQVERGVDAKKSMAAEE